MTGNYNNPSTPAERCAVVENDRRVRRGGTYHDIASSEAAVPRGRFTAHERSTVTGATPASRYPTLPASSPWASEPVGQEPPLGFSVDEMIPAGEPHEVMASLAKQQGGEGINPSASSPGAPPSGDEQRVGAGPIQTSAPSARRRRSTNAER